MECLLPYLCMATVPHIMIGLQRMLDYRGVGLGRFHCIYMLSDILNRMLSAIILLLPSVRSGS